MGEEADADWQDGLVEWGMEDAENHLHPLRKHLFDSGTMRCVKCRAYYFNVHKDRPEYCGGSVGRPPMPSEGK